MLAIIKPHGGGANSVGGAKLYHKIVCSPSSHYLHQNCSNMSVIKVIGEAVREGALSVGLRGVALSDAGLRGVAWS